MRVLLLALVSIVLFSEGASSESKSQTAKQLTRVPVWCSTDHRQRLRFRADGTGTFEKNGKLIPIKWRIDDHGGDKTPRAYFKGKQFLIELRAGNQSFEWCDSYPVDERDTRIFVNPKAKNPDIRDDGQIIADAEREGERRAKQTLPFIGTRNGPDMVLIYNDDGHGSLKYHDQTSRFRWRLIRKRSIRVEDGATHWLYRIQTIPNKGIRPEEIEIIGSNRLVFILDSKPKTRGARAMFINFWRE